jgi:hypothetical protein
MAIRFIFGSDVGLFAGDVLYFCCKWLMSYFFRLKKQVIHSKLGNI